MSEATEFPVSSDEMRRLDCVRTVRGIHLFMAGEGGLWLASLVFCGLTLVINERGDFIPLPFSTLTPAIARVAGETGIAAWLPLCSVACWRSIAREGGWTSWSTLVAMFAALSSVVATLFTELQQ